MLFIPAHIWTPHFAVLGASSGFDSLEECFEDLLPHIFALETGLSSDPPMNSRLSALDRYAIVSNSDAHSAPKIGREATCFHTDLSFPAIRDALPRRDPARSTTTIEFYPEEGKYHLDGHRKCGVCWTPPQTLAADGLCPECGRKLTIGVLHRVESLADRAAAFSLDVDDILTGGEPALASNQAPARPAATPKRVLPPTAVVAAPARLRSGFVWPVDGRVVRRFGPGASGERNDGIKIAVPLATPVKAAADGVVAYVGDGIAALGGRVVVDRKTSWRERV